ncbi:polysaccharide deacetylase family protein [Desmospora activa]|uniref:Polysaccharide deacetylase family sporulation protein PdaB n=1 Tax=Desmospora activa DSM 45169 TaxID=1121389 RepID=A0A2T4Z3L7_9BACL|nr:polysaccharide deacetylase family protein [Desmospora activa]PTM56485.1 polysaccharide deacetylase family sporulation protein PdaB [Desmospora activa DSM 45169]
MSILQQKNTIILLTCLVFFLDTLAVPTWAAPPHQMDRFYFERNGSVIWEVPTTQPMIALTFDDGPNPRYTTEILDILKKYDAKATFFVIGEQVEKYPELVKREIREGHEVGNHTFHHRSIKRQNAATISHELAETDILVLGLTGIHPHLFRPPGGYYDQPTVETATKAGYQVVMWSWHQDTRDWSRPGVHKIASTVINNARNGDIVLLHDHGGNRKQTVAALKRILPALKKKGYQFITVSEMMKKGKRKVYQKQKSQGI